MSRYFKKRRFMWFRKHKVLMIIFSIILFFSLMLVYFNFIVNPVVIHMSEAKVKSLTQRAVTASVYEVIQYGPIYDDIIKITRNNEGDPVMINTDSLQINKLTLNLVKTSQTKLETVGEKGIDIPIGSFSGMPIFVGRGPIINIRLNPIGIITCNFKSEFVSAGINQTNHKIYVNINSNVNVILPLTNKIVTTTTQLIIAESIIIGKIPSTFLNSTSLDEMLNLVPM